MVDDRKLAELEDILEHTFSDRQLFITALTHSSYAHERIINRTDNYERLEFLGDAVLEMTSSEYLYYKYPDMTEGRLTQKRASIVCEKSLASFARHINLGNYILIGRGEEITGGRNRDSMLADIVEALIGAVYIDGSVKPAKNFVTKVVLPWCESNVYLSDSKSLLQEITQREYGICPEYICTEEYISGHSRIFTAVVYIGKKEFCKGTGSTKKEAEKQAAYCTINKLQSEYGV